MKKLLSLSLAVILGAITVMGCAGSSNTTTESSTTESSTTETTETEAETAQATDSETTDDTTVSTEGETTDFTIAFCTWVGYAPLYIAQEKGYFEEVGINPTLTIIEDESQYASAMVSNSIQALGNVLDREVIHFASGTPEQYLFTMDLSTGGDGIIASEDIQTMDDLKGKTIALDKSATSYFFFLTALADSNITEDDITIMEMGNSEAGAAFVAGNVDAAVTWEPWLSTADQREGGHVLLTSADYPKTIIDVMTVRQEFAQDNPNTVKALEEAWYKAIQFYNENPEEACEIMANGLGLDVEEVMEECEGITFYGRDENAEFNTEGSEDSIYDIADLAASFWLEKDLIESDDLTDFFAK